MKNGRVGIAILGAGAIADVHVQACLASPDLCEVLAVCDRFPEKARQLVSAHRLNADTPEDVRQVLSREDIDAVSICLPPSEHAWAAVAALNAAMDESPEGILRSVDKAVADFVGEAEQFDDLTMLCIEYRGRDAAEGTENEGING